MKAVSKYRNVVGTFVSKNSYYSDLSPSQTSDANVISVSGTKIAFVCSKNGGGEVGIIPLDAVGKKRESPIKYIHAHSGNQIFDIQFSPFDDEIFGTCASDGQVKLWNTDCENLSCLSGHKRRVEVIRFHPISNGIIASGSVDKTGLIWDVEAQKSVFTLNTNGSIEGLSWNQNGSLLASTCGDKMIRIWDPRSEKEIHCGSSHSGVKAQRCVWLGARNQILSSGIGKFRERELAIWDASNLEAPLKRINIDSSSGILIPLFDPDTNIIYLGGKGDSCIRSYELLDSDKLYNELQAVSYSEGIKCVSLAPKRILNVMSCEISRVFTVLNNSIAYVSYLAPRKSKAIFHADLFPFFQQNELVQDSFAEG